MEREGGGNRERGGNREGEGARERLLFLLLQLLMTMATVSC